MLTCGKANETNYFLVWYENQVCSWGLIALQVGTDCAALHMQCFHYWTPCMVQEVPSQSPAPGRGWWFKQLVTLETMNQLESRGPTELHHCLTAPLLRELQTVLQTPLRQLLLCAVQFICLNVLVTARVEHPKHCSRCFFCEEMHIAHI